MLTKLGVATVGIAAGLVAMAPLASAGEAPHQDQDKGSHQSHDGGHHAKGAGKGCDFKGGNAGAGSNISGDSLANGVAQAPVAGNNIGNIADCSSFLNDNLNGNFSGNDVHVL